MLIFTIILQWFSNDTAFNRKTPTHSTKVTRKTKPSTKFALRSKLWIVTNELNIETRTQEVDFVLCICLKHVIGPFKIHHVNIYFTKRPFWSHTFHVFNNRHKYKYSACPQANSDTLDDNGTFVASLHVQIIYCLLVWTRYLKTCFQCIYRWIERSTFGNELCST